MTESTEHDNTSAPDGNEDTSTGDNQAAKKKILLVDDHPIFRHGLTELLNRPVDLVVCGHADSAPTALAEMRQLKPDLAILDITLQRTNGVQLVKLLKAQARDVSLL